MAPPSRLRMHKAAIAEARAAGTSYRNLARTYGVSVSTMHEFVNGYTSRHNPLRKCQYDTLRISQRQLERSRMRAEEAYLT